MRLIDADVLKHRLCEIAPAYKCDENTAQEIDDGITLMYLSELIDSIPTVDIPTNAEWIPCSERLPDISKSVLFYTVNGGVAEGVKIVGDGWMQFRWASHYEDEEVIAWMPLPEPYKGDEK